MNDMSPDWKEATDFSGKVIVLTGGASGIGRATALQYVRAGAVVYVGDIDQAGGDRVSAEAQALGGRLHFIKLDLSDKASINAFAGAVRADTDTIDVIANCAGWEKVGPFMENTPDYWDRIIAVNYVGPVRMIQALLPAMIIRARGKIVMVASDAGRVGSMGETFYAGSKGAVIAFCKSLAREMARYNIQCNVISPGPTDTPLFHGAIENPKLREALVKAIPMHRLGRPEEVAQGILFLSSGAASFITGQVLSISGGLTMC